MRFREHCQYQFNLKQEGNPTMSAYSSSKAGVICFTKVLGKEIDGTGLINNCITPAVISTETIYEIEQESVSYMVSKISINRLVQSEGVAEMVA
jgi:2-dehydro-3-deoxy-L-rhamnonate dehydrogenase (NAD+)